MILERHRQGLTVSAIARQLGLDCKAVCRYIERGLAPPTMGLARRGLCECIAAYPGLSAVRLWRELRDRGYSL
jgi:hypothetical protein